MNFLAHAVLAGSDPADRVGGLMGDFVKGPLPAGLPPDLASGVALHRAIDGFADRHPAFLASRARVSAGRRRLAGVLVDMFYDHLLARDWAEHAASNRVTPALADYTELLYADLRRRTGDLPEAAHDVSERMAAGNWLGSYGDVRAVAGAIDRMSIHRLRRANALAGGIEEFLADAAGFEDDFRRFFPDALAFAEDWRTGRDRPADSAPAATPSRAPTAP